jgi:hypothetical protein
MPNPQNPSVADIMNTANAVIVATPEMCRIAETIFNGVLSIPDPGPEQTNAITNLVSKLPTAPFEMATNAMSKNATAVLNKASLNAQIADGVLNSRLGRWGAAQGAKVAGASMGAPFAGDMAAKALTNPTTGKMIGEAASVVNTGIQGVQKKGIPGIVAELKKAFTGAAKSGESSGPSAPTDNNKPKQP